MSIAELSNGTKINYNYLKKNDRMETLVIINGTFNVLQEWEVIVSNLSEQYLGNILTFDLRNQGGSTKMTEEFSYKDLMEDITLFFEYLGLRDILMVTYSSGSSFAVDYIVNNPGKVKKLIMGAPVVNPFGIFKNQLISQASNRFYELGASLKDIVVLSLPIMVSGKFLEMIKNDFENIKEGFEANFDKNLMLPFVKAWDQNEMTLSKLEKVVNSVETHYIYGEEDIFNAQVFVQQLQNEFKNIDFYKLQTGHAFHMENMQAFIDILKSIVLK